MKRHVALAILVLIMAALACNLSAGDDPTVPPNNIPIGQATATPDGVVIVTVTPSPTTVVPTATSQQVATLVPTAVLPPVLSGLSFSTTAGGAATTNFANGTQEVYARWNYSNVPIGTLMRRVWYRDGVVVASVDETWSSIWGTTGRLTHVKLYDYEDGLTAGNYYVIISLPAYGVSVDGNFTIAAGAPFITNLTVSTRSDGPATSLFPYGTPEVFVRFDFGNIPVGTAMQREWYRNSTIIVSRTEAWSSNWGSVGRLTHISLFDYESGYGLEPGNYRVVVYLRDQPTVRAETTFTIEANAGPQFSNLRFASEPFGTPRSTFQANTTRVYALWDYTFVPVGAQMKRVWLRNGEVYVDRTETWNFDTYGTNGTVRDVYIFDEIDGLPNGTYTVTISLVGQPGVEVTGQFKIGP